MNAMTGHPATATYSGEEVEVTFSCEMEVNDYGVPRSPVWVEPDPSTTRIETLTILGVSVDPKALPSDLVGAIHALADEVEFEPEEA